MYQKGYMYQKTPYRGWFSYHHLKWWFMIAIGDCKLAALYSLLSCSEKHLINANQCYIVLFCHSVLQSPGEPGFGEQHMINVGEPWKQSRFSHEIIQRILADLCVFPFAFTENSLSPGESNEVNFFLTPFLRIVAPPSADFFKRHGKLSFSVRHIYCLAHSSKARSTWLSSCSANISPQTIRPNLL